MWWVRLVLRSRWESGRGDLIGRFSEAAEDLEPRPIDKGELSVFKAADDSEGRRITILNTLTNSKPKTVDYLLVPETCFESTKVSVRHEACADQHPFLSERHFVVSGLLDLNNRLDVARAILTNLNHKLFRIRKAELKAEAGTMIATDESIRGFMRYSDAW